MDTELLGDVVVKATGRLMEDFGDDHDKQLVAVGVVMVIDIGEHTLTRVVSSCDMHYEEVGLFTDALGVARYPGTHDDDDHDT